MTTSRKLRQAVAYERLSYRLDITDKQRESFRRRARKLRTEDAQNKAVIARFQQRKQI